MSTRAGEWKLGGARQAPSLARLCLAALLYAGGKKEKVVNSQAGFGPKPAVGLAPRPAGGEDKFDKSFTPEKPAKTEFKDNHELNRTRRSTRETEACILTS